MTGTGKPPQGARSLPAAGNEPRLNRSQNDLQRELEAARNAARAAGAILSGHFRAGSYQVGSKGRDNPVTSADLEANRTLAELLCPAFPDYGWLSEESADQPERLSRQRVWVVDPLDGTKEFIAGVPEFAVSIALVEDAKPILGVTYNPITGELFWAARELGCHLDGRPVGVSPTARPQDALVLASRSETARGEWRSLAGAVRRIDPIGSVAYKLARVSAGLADATWSATPKSEWDVAAGVALVNEAGGVVSDLQGDELRFNRPSVKLAGFIACNPKLHLALLKLAGGAGGRGR